MTSLPPSALWRLMRFARPYRGRMLLAVGAALVSAVATALYAFMVGPLLRAVLLGGEVRWASWSWNVRAWAGTLPVLLVGVAVVKGTAQVLQAGWMQGLAQRILTDLRNQLYAHLLRWPPRALETRHSGELLSRLTADVGQVEFTVSLALASYVRDSLQLLALLITCAVIDGKLFLVTFVVLPLTLYPVTRFARAVKRSARSTHATLGRLTALAADALNNLPVIQSYGAQPLLMSQFDREQENYLKELKRSLFVRGAASPAVEVLGFFGVALAIAWGSRAIQHDPALATRLLSFLTAELLMYQPVKALAGTFTQVAHGLAAAQRVFELSDEPIAPEGGAEAGPLVRGVELRELRVSYGPGPEALRGVTLAIPAGKKVALVGASGSGKSTTLSVLLRFVESSGGEVTWDGTPIGLLARGSLRAQLGWVPQEPVLFSGTVRENLLLARPEASESELWEALRRAHAEAFVHALPLGLEEPVGERGGRMSGGQRQRLAIARAFLRRPSLLLLDEPTSALDAASEAEVQAGLKELMAGRTTVVIAHRLSTVRDADLIYVLEEGRVVESGTHLSLSEAGGRYCALLAQDGIVVA